MSNVVFVTCIVASGSVYVPAKCRFAAICEHTADRLRNAVGNTSSDIHTVAVSWHFSGDYVAIQN